MAKKMYKHQLRLWFSVRNGHLGRATPEIPWRKHGNKPESSSWSAHRIGHLLMDVLVFIKILINPKLGIVPFLVDGRIWDEWDSLIFGSLKTGINTCTQYLFWGGERRVSPHQVIGRVLISCMQI